MSFGFFLKALRQLLELITAGFLRGPEGEKMKKAKETKKTVKKVAKAAPAKKVAAKKASKTAATPKKAKNGVKPTVTLKNEKVEKASKKALKAELSNKQAETSKLVETIVEEPKATAKTLREALAGTIKKASEMEPDAILHVDEAQEKTDAEKKAFFRKIAAAGTNFDSVYKLAKTLKTKNYKMNDVFEAKTPIMHKILGWGFILTCENNRIQVLFKDGVKTLVTNYQQNK